MSKPAVSIVIRCCNEAEHITRLLKGIYEQSLRDIEVIIVDSGSTDKTLSIASRFPVVIKTISADEFSFGRALNVGGSAATGEVLVLASAHVYPTHRRWLENLISPFKDPKVALSYGKQRGNEKNKYSEHQIFSKWFPEHSVSVQRSPFCNNANAAVRRSLWEKIPYDENLTGLEDIDWAKRVIGKGYYLSYVAEAEVIHLHDEKYSGIFNRYFRKAIVFYQLFPDQKFKLLDCLWLWLINTISDYTHALHDRVVMKNIIQIPMFRLMQFLGTYRGYVKRDPVTDALRQRFYYPNGLVDQEISQETEGVLDDDCIDYVNLENEKKDEQPY